MKFNLLFVLLIIFFGSHGTTCFKAVIPVLKDYYDGRCKIILQDKCIKNYDDNPEYFACLLDYYLGRHPEAHASSMPNGGQIMRNKSNTGLLAMINLYWCLDSQLTCINRQEFSKQDAGVLITYINKLRKEGIKYPHLHTANIL
jgi:hypothetical protein